ncbi:MAG: hypothetical protein M3Q68_05245 [Actinomycetota bacterium]|nr:hypothetical protein [Actinomycetota bacterium]
MSALGEMRSRLETLEQMQQSASDAEANGTEVKAWAEDVLAKIDAFTVPDVSVARVSAEQMASIRGCIQNFEEGLGVHRLRRCGQPHHPSGHNPLGVPSFNAQDIRNFWQPCLGTSTPSMRSPPGWLPRRVAQAGDVRADHAGDGGAGPRLGG